MIKGFNESTLGTSEIFNDLKEMTGNDPREKAIKLIKSSKTLTNNDIEGAYIQIKQYSNSLDRAAIKAFDEGSTVLIYNDAPSLSMTKAIPFITFRVKDKFLTYVFMDNFITKSRDGILNVQAAVLRDMLIGALIANKLKSNYERLVNSQSLQRILTRIYSRFVLHILHRIYSIRPDRILCDSVQYYISKFFLIRTFGSLDNPQNIDTLSSQHFRYIDEMKFEEIKNIYNQADPQKFSDLIELIKNASTRVKDLSKGTFLSEWINYYYPPALLAVDNIEYLIFMIVTLLHGNNVISINASDIVKEDKDIKTFKEELLKLV